MSGGMGVGSAHDDRLHTNSSGVVENNFRSTSSKKSKVRWAEILFNLTIILNNCNNANI